MPGARFLTTPPSPGGWAPTLQLCSGLAALKTLAHCSPGGRSGCNGNREVWGAVVQGCWCSSTSFLTGLGVLVLLPAVGHLPAPVGVGGAWGHGILGAAAPCLPSSTGREGAVMQLASAGGCEQEMPEAAQQREALRSGKRSVGAPRQVVQPRSAPNPLHASPGPRSALEPLCVPQLLAEAEASQGGAAGLGAALGNDIRSRSGGVQHPEPNPLQPASRGAKRSGTSLVNRTFYSAGVPAHMAAAWCSLDLHPHLLAGEAAGRTKATTDVKEELPAEEKRKEVGSGVPSG